MGCGDVGVIGGRKVIQYADEKCIMRSALKVWPAASWISSQRRARDIAVVMVGAGGWGRRFSAQAMMRVWMWRSLSSVERRMRTCKKRCFTKEKGGLGRQGDNETPFSGGDAFSGRVSASGYVGVGGCVQLDAIDLRVFKDEVGRF